jgi:hypothetical protein
VSSSFHIFQEFLDLQIWRTSLIVEKDGIVNVKNYGLLLGNIEFIHLHTHHFHRIVKFVVAFQHAHLLILIIFQHVFEQMPTRQFVDDLYPKFGVKQ